eukprot:15452332-Alexandrium_andersonii.AAC.1
MPSSSRPTPASADPAGGIFTPSGSAARSRGQAAAGPAVAIGPALPVAPPLCLHTCARSLSEVLGDPL